MARWVVFDTLNRANQAVTQANNRLRTAFTNLGYTVTAAGVVGKRLDGTDNPNAPVTTGWCEPRQRLTDGKWCILHPENHPLRDAIVDATSGQTWSQYLLGGVTPSWFTVEEEQPNWWPVST